MKLKLDEKNDALYFRLLDEKAIVESEEVRPGVVLDYDSDGNVIGIELLNLSQRFSIDILKNFHFETA